MNFSDAASHYATAYYSAYGSVTPPEYLAPSVTPASAGPQIADRGKYFFLPAAGYYISDRHPYGSFINRTVLHSLGTEGLWWSCDGTNGAPNRAANLHFNQSMIEIGIQNARTYMTLAPIWKVQ